MVVASYWKGDAMRKTFLILLVVLALVLAIGLVGCGGGDTDSATTTDPGAVAGAVDGGTMSFYINEPAYIDPYNTQETEGMAVAYAIFEPLVKMDMLNPENLIPGAAESWEANDDASVWTFKLNPNGKFSDGTPVKAGDFVYAWNRMVNPETVNTLTNEVDPSVIGYHLGYVKGYEEVAEGKATEMSGLKALDDNTLEVTLTQSFADFPYVAGHPSLGPTPKDAVESGVDFNGSKVAYGEMPIGNGPFKMAEPWKHDQYIKVVKNENYGTGKAAHLDGIDFMIFKDPDTAYTEFLAGNLDFTSIGEGKITEALSQFGESKNGYTANPGEQVLLGPQTGVYYLLMNNNKPPMDNPDVRRAVSLAINRQAICDIVFDGTRDPAGNILPPGVAGFVENSWADSRYDVEAAKKALADAGYPNGEGLEKLTLSFNSGGGHEKIMELIQADLKAIGIETDFESLEWDTYLKRLDEGNFTFGRLGWAADYPIAYNFLYSLFDSRSGDNKSGYNNPEVDKMIAEAQTIADPVARADKMAEISKIIGESNTVAPIMYYKHNHVASDRMNNFTFGPMHLTDYVNTWMTADRQ